MFFVFTQRLPGRVGVLTRRRGLATFSFPSLPSRKRLLWITGAAVGGMLLVGGIIFLAPPNAHRYVGLQFIPPNASSQQFHDVTGNQKTPYIIRSDMVSQLDAFLTARGNHAILAGAQGTGKSSLAKYYATKREGVIYIRASSIGHEFAHAIAEAISTGPIYDGHCWAGLLHKAQVQGLDWASYHTDDLLPLCKKQLFEAARVYKDSTGKTLVVFFDNLDMVYAASKPRIWQQLLEMIKEAADTKLIRLVLVTSLESDFGMLRSHSSLGWTIDRTLEMIDLTPSEALLFINMKCDEDLMAAYAPEEIEAAVRELSGGRVALLLMLVNAIFDGQSLQVIRNKLFSQCEESFHEAGMVLSTDRRFASRWKLASQLLQAPDKRVQMIVVRALLQEQDDLDKDPSWSKVFCLHTDGSVAFQTAAHETFARERLAAKDSQK